MYGDWYARNMYHEGSEQYRYHIRHYGHPSKFGYKDIVQLWKAEQFDPESLMDLYVAAGAKYFVAQAMHHDNFFNYDSKIHRFNSVNMGPKKDIVALWKAATTRRGLPFGLTEHLGGRSAGINLIKDRIRKALMTETIPSTKICTCRTASIMIRTHSKGTEAMVYRKFSVASALVGRHQGGHRLVPAGSAVLRRRAAVRQRII